MNRKTLVRTAALFVLAAAVSTSARAQAPADSLGASPAAAPAAPAATSAAPATSAPAPSTSAAAPAAGAARTATAAPRHRAGWLSDDVDIQVGQVVTVIIDEATSARESVNQHGSDQRSVNAGFSGTVDDESVIGNTGVKSKYAVDSRKGGEASRRGDLVGNLTTRVTEVDGHGLARIEGAKSVVIDGRKQEITLKGWVRPDDLLASNIVHSSRVADAEITYKGNAMGPKLGFVGKVVSMLWPF